MSSTYKRSDQVPNGVLCNRLYELSIAITKGFDSVRREFTMRVPAELDRDADLVLSEAASRIQSQAAQIEELESRLDKAHSALIRGAAALLRQRTFQDDDPNDESLRLLAIELRGVAESLDLIYNLARIESNGRIED